MSLYTIQLLDSAVQDLARLDKSMSRRIIKRLHWLAENFEQVRPETLRGNLADFYKFRVGDYRVLYETLTDEKLLVVHQVGHRREIYK